MRTNVRERAESLSVIGPSEHQPVIGTWTPKHLIRHGLEVGCQCENALLIERRRLLLSLEFGKDLFVDIGPRDRIGPSR